MRIALTIHAMYGGGAERLMSQLASRWALAGHEIHLVTWAEASTDRYAVPAQVCRHALGMMQPSQNQLHGIWANYQRVRALRSTLCTIQPEFVLSFCDQMNVATLQAAHRLRVPVWIAEHSNPAKQKLSAMWELWRKRTYPHCAGCIVLTKDIAEYMQRWIDPSHICVIPNAIATPVTHCDEQANTPKSRHVVLALGRLSPEKGGDILIKAWRQIHSQVGDWELQIAGDGPQRSELEDLSRDLPSIKFLGWLDNPWEAYAESSIYVLPSRYEGFPVALVEAMSQRMACISTRSSDALNELSADQTAVVLVDLKSPEQLGESILALIQDPVRRKELGVNAQVLSRNYSWEKIGPLWDQLLLNATQFTQTR